jgi:hypothetical protein
VNENQKIIEEIRKEEYESSYQEANNYPDDLYNMEFRLRKRIKNKRRKTSIKIITNICAVFMLFVFLMNSSTAFADTVLKIPVIGSLAEFVCFDKGLQNAVNNKYAQKVDLIESDNEYTLGIPYVISDSKRLVLFFQIPENLLNKYTRNIQVDITKIIDQDTGKEFGGIYESNGYSLSDKKKNNSLYCISIRSTDANIPNNLKIYTTLKREYIEEEHATESDLDAKTNIDTQNIKGDYTIEGSNIKEEELGEYVFDLGLKDYPKPKTITVNKEIKIKGQSIWIHSISEYPTGTEVSIHIPKNNDYVINGINVKAIDNQGEDWASPNGITSIGEEGDENILYYLEGDYFSNASLDKIRIDGVRLFKRDESKITVDLQEQTMNPMVEDLNIKRVEKKGEKALITFEYGGDGCLGLFQHNYKDTKGNQYEFNSESGTTTLNDKNENSFEVIWPKDNKIILTRSMSPLIKLEEPVEINLQDYKK